MQRLTLKLSITRTESLLSIQERFSRNPQIFLHFPMPEKTSGPRRETGSRLRDQAFPGEWKRSHSRDQKTFLALGNGINSVDGGKNVPVESRLNGKTSNSKDNIIMQGRQQTIGPINSRANNSRKISSLYCCCYCGLPRLRWLSVYCIVLLPSHCCCGFSGRLTAVVVSVADSLLLWFQWLTLAACVLMWGPCLTELLLSKWELGENYTNISQCFFSNKNLDTFFLYSSILTKKTEHRYIIQSMFNVFNISC
jgi:hypothetical protein